MFKSRKVRLGLLAAIVALALLHFAWLRLMGRRDKPQFPTLIPLTNDSITPDPTAVSPGYQPGLKDFWDSFSKAVVEAKPNGQVGLPPDFQGVPINSFANLKKDFNYRPDLIQLSPEDVDDLRNAHSRFVARIPELAPQLPFAKGTKGIVTTASDSFMPVLIVSLRALQRSGTKLPVEVFLESQAVYEKEVCEVILPTLNARCLVISEILDAVPNKIQVSKYQLKVLSMLFSSFDEMLLLDADNLAIEKPEDLFSTEPFLSKGFVSWPDYWASTASPHYYNISSQTPPSPTLRAASESGQLLLSKSLHTPTLLLSTYYNILGPSHYYPLLSQGAPGQGDKETFLAAALALSAPFYTVITPPRTFGFHSSSESNFKGTAALQHSPSHDYQYHVLHNNSNIDPSKIDEIPVSFIHAQTYKMDAAAIPDIFNSEINQRIFGSKERVLKLLGRDVEKQMWGDALYTGCQLERAFRAWEGEKGVCKRIGRVYKFLFN